MMRNRWLFVYVLLLALSCWLVWPALAPAQSAPTGFSRLGTTVLAGTNGVVSQPSDFWMNNVVGAGDIGVDTDSQGRLRIHVMISTNMSVSVQWDSLLNMPAVLQDHAALSNAVTQAASALQTEVDPAFATWLAGDWVDINQSIQLAIQQAAQSANLGGDLLTVDGNATVIAVRNIPVANTVPQVGQTWLMGDDGIMCPGSVAQDGAVTGFVAVEDTATGEDMPPDTVGFTREIRGGQAVLPFYIGGTEIGFFSTNGLSLTIGSLNYLNDVFLEAFFRAQDGTVATPAYAFAADTTMGWYRKSDGGGYVWAYAQGGQDVALLGPDRLEVATGKKLYLPVGSMLAPSLSMLCDTGRMGWYSKIDTTTGDRAWAFTHGLYGEILSITPQGIRLSAGKTIYGFDGGGGANDTNAVLKSSTFTAWTNAGGTFTNEGVVATSPLLSNGVATVSYDASGMIPVVAQMSPDGSAWSTFDATNTAMMVRLLATNAIPLPCDGTVTISNIVATSYTQPDLFGTVNDTAGQTVLVDSPTDPRGVVNLSTLDTAVQAGVAAVAPDAWSQYPATQIVQAPKGIALGGIWSITTNATGLAISGGGLPFMTMEDGDGSLQGLTIAAMSITGSVATIDVATNGVAGRPLAQWAASLSEPVVWMTLTPSCETYPALTNGYYRIVATLPGGTSGFVCAAYEANHPTVSIRANVIPAEGGTYDLGNEQKPWRSLYLEGDTLYVGGFPISASTNGVLSFGGNVIGETQEYYESRTNDTFALMTSLISATISSAPTAPTFTPPSPSAFDWGTLSTNYPLSEWVRFSTNNVPE